MTGTFGLWSDVRILSNQLWEKSDATIKRIKIPIQAQNLVKEFEKTHTVST